MKTKKLGYSNRCLYDLEGIRETLEKMALKGWKCKKFGYTFTHYEKIEPQALKYDVIFLPSLSQFDGVPTESQETLIAMCEESGWEYICQWGNAVVFCSTEENPTPIETDETLKLENIHKSMKKEVLPSLYILMFLFPLLAWFQTANIHTQPEQFYGGYGIFGLPTMIVASLIIYLSTWHYFDWYKKSKKSLEQGESCVRPLNIFWFFNILSISTIVIVIFALSSFLDSQFSFLLFFQLLNLGFMFGLIAFLRQRKFSTKLKHLIYWAVCLTLPAMVMGYITMQVISQVDFNNFNHNEDFPLEISDIRPEDTSKYHKNHISGGTFLMEWGTFFMSHDTEGLGLNYSLYQSKSDYIAEKMVHGKLFLESYEKEWGLRWEQIYEVDDLKVWEQFDDDTSARKYNIQSGKNLITISFGDGFTEDEKVKSIEILLGIFHKQDE